MKKIMSFGLFLWMSLSFSLKAQDQAAKVQQTLEDRVQKIVHAFDKNAIVFVTATAKKKKQQTILPGTALLLQGMTVMDGKGNVEMESIDIQVMTAMKELPPALLTAIKDSAKIYGVEPVIGLKPLPVTDTSPTAVEESLTLRDFLFGGLLAILILILGFHFMSSRNSVQGLAAKLEKISSDVVQALEAGSSGRNMESSDMDMRQLSAGTSGPSDSNALHDLTSEGFKALFMDAYWAELDEYTAYLWHHSSVAQKNSLLNEVPYIAEYAATLSGKKEADRGFALDPYYFQPLPLSHLSNAHLSELVKKRPELLNVLPELRLSFLTLSATERLQLSQKATKNTKREEFNDLQKLDGSLPRKVKIQRLIAPTTIEEERELISNESIDSDSRKSLLTLGWLSSLPREARTNILKDFSAAALASAWVGPQECLDEIGSSLPDKKFKLVQEYVKTSSPSRNSPAFRKLHELAINYQEPLPVKLVEHTQTLEINMKFSETKTVKG